MFAASVSYASVAYAQTAVPQETTAASNEVPQTSVPSAPEGEIIVTGSRLVRDGSKAPTPVTVVTAEALQQTAPSNIPDALNKLPIFANSSNQATGANFAATSSPAGNYLNLRGLGSQRVLVLLNGSRVTPTTNSNAVDTNMLPNILISRVDVVTGGASAAYGSDAISGVVNFVLDEKLKGIKAVAQTGISTQGDDLSYRLGIAYGTQVGESIHLIASYEHYKSDGIPSLFDRKWAPDVPIISGAGTTANPYVLTPNGRTNQLAYGGEIEAGLFKGLQFRPDGTLTPFVRGLPTGSTFTDQGGDGAVFGRDNQFGGETIAASLKTDQAFARVAWDLTPTLQLFAQGSYGRSVSGYNASPQSHRVGTNRATTIFADNPYLRPDLAAQLNAAGQSSFQIGRMFDDIPFTAVEADTKFYSGQFGVKGDLGQSWKFDVNYVYGRSTLDFSSSEFDSRRFFAALDAVKDPSGNIVCGVTLRNPGLLPGCVPINVIGEGNISQAAYNYVRQESRYRTVNEMNYVNANISGNLFHLPAGDVSLAAGVEYRTQSLSQTTNADPARFAGTQGAADRVAYFQGIRGVPSSALTFLITNVGLASGQQTVKEGYGELLIPLLKDVRFAENLELNLAGRYTDYKTSGAVQTYKVGGSWTPFNGIRLRATQSRDIAAPGLYDLFAGQNVQNLGIVDPLTNISGVPQVVSAGNAALQPEKSDTTTVGLVISPQGIPGLTVSIDAYRIKIRGAIQTTSATDQLASCQASGGTAPVCALIIRPFPFSNTTPANYPTQIFVVPQNLAQLTQKGIDFEIGYVRPISDLFPSMSGTVSFRAFVNYLDTYDTQAAGNQPVIHRAGKVAGIGVMPYGSSGLPKWRGLLTQTYSGDRFSIGFNERFTGSYNRFATGVYDPAIAHSPNRVYVDTNLSYDILEKGRAQIFLNVQNLFDTDPPIFQSFTATNNATPTDKYIYDVIGRYFTAGVRVKF